MADYLNDTYSQSKPTFANPLTEEAGSGYNDYLNGTYNQPDTTTPNEFEFYDDNGRKRIFANLRYDVKYVNVYSPYVGSNGDWYIYSIEERGYVDSGVYAIGEALVWGTF